VDEEHPLEEFVGQVGVGEVLHREAGSFSEGVRRLLECLRASVWTLFERAQVHYPRAVERELRLEAAGDAPRQRCLPPFPCLAAEKEKPGRSRQPVRREARDQGGELVESGLGLVDDDKEWADRRDEGSGIGFLIEKAGEPALSERSLTKLGGQPGLTRTTASEQKREREPLSLQPACQLSKLAVPAVERHDPVLGQAEVDRRAAEEIRRGAGWKGHVRRLQEAPERLVLDGRKEPRRSNAEGGTEARLARHRGHGGGLEAVRPEVSRIDREHTHEKRSTEERRPRIPLPR